MRRFFKKWAPYDFFVKQLGGLDAVVAGPNEGATTSVRQHTLLTVPGFAYRFPNRSRNRYRMSLNSLLFLVSLAPRGRLLRQKHWLRSDSSV
jgi:hypothetical protein